VSQLHTIRQAIGPGILFAGAAIGGSHLVQSTRAGASHGFDLVVIVLLVLLCKYPFFEFAHRYTVATGESLLQGYLRLGRPALWLFFVIALGASFVNVAAVTLVTASLAGVLFGITAPIVVTSLLVLAVVGAILVLGRYRSLDLLMKVMVVVLGVLTLTAVAVALVHGPAGDPDYTRPAIWSVAGVSFLLALMGWMPAPVDVAVWPSLWILEKHRGTGTRPGLRAALFDFNLGYLTTGILALAFISFGALVMFGTGETFSNSGLRFSHQLINMYTATLGDWSRWLIAMVAFITMFSTTLTVCDGYARTLGVSMGLLFPVDERWRRRSYWFVLPLLMICGLLVIGLFLRGIKTMMDFATILAFLTAPLVAGLNFRVMLGSWVDAAYRPGAWLRGLAWLGIVYLAGFGLVYIYLRLFA